MTKKNDFQPDNVKGDAVEKVLEVGDRVVWIEEGFTIEAVVLSLINVWHASVRRIGPNYQKDDKVCISLRSPEKLWNCGRMTA